VEIDTSTDYGARVARRLGEELIIWLTTVGSDLTPQPSPVWFLWDGETALIYSQPGTPKLRNIRERPRVSLSFNSTETGGDVVVITGDAWLDPETPPANELPVYIEKYSNGLAGIGLTPEAFAEAYSVPLRVRPTSLRGF
jgi:PPOX class probable F420-dependent enzyme